MTVVLSGIGGDQTNIYRNGPLHADGTFEYIPIPEKTRETTESKTFGTWPLSDGKTAADVISTIDPTPGRDGRGPISDPDTIASWPVHHDPNFEALTYGEHRGSADARKRYVGYLSALEDGDVVAFYTGLVAPGETAPHRYIIGYMTVRESISTESLTREETRRVLATHPENAHAKRAIDGELFYDRYGTTEKYVVIVDGRKPGGLFERDPIRISDRYVREGRERKAHYLREDVECEFDVVNPTPGPINLTRKPAIRLDMTGERFRGLVGTPGER